jgi:putative aminopeptidase FrvX
MHLDKIYEQIEDLVMLHSPSGDEAQIDQYLLTFLSKIAKATHRVWQDAAGNIIYSIPGRDETQSIAITAHKDEIAMMVQRIDSDGRLRLARVGGSFPWIYGEGVVDILGHEPGTGNHLETQGILSFGSRHVSHQSPQKAQQNDAPLTWDDAWVETFRTPEELAAQGVQPGARVVIGKHRKRPLRMGDRVASYTLDNKASVAILLLLAETLVQPSVNTYLVFSAREEIGCLGALHYTLHQKPDELIALEVAPVAKEYPISFDDQPVLLSSDNYSFYTLDLNHRLDQVAKSKGLSIQHCTLSGFGSDASLCIKNGHVARAACLGFPTENTHGYEITSLAAIWNVYQVLFAYTSG